MKKREKRKQKPSERAVFNGIGRKVGFYLDDPAKDDVLSVEPRSGDSGNEKLRSIGVGASVGHAEVSGTNVLQLEVLLSKEPEPKGMEKGKKKKGNKKKEPHPRTSLPRWTCHRCHRHG